MAISQKAWTVAVAGLAGLLCGALDAQPIEVPGQVGKVTVYRGQALVTRLIPAQLPDGLSEVVVPDLPEQIVPDSLFATAVAPVEVRAVRYRTRAVNKEPREEVRQIDDEMERVQAEIERNEMLQDVAKHVASYLDKLEQFVAPTAQVELTQGVLDAETLKALTLFILEQRSSQADSTLELRSKGRKLKEQLDLLRRKRAELTRDSSRTVREAVLFVDAGEEGPAELQLSYLVGNAGWEPIYNLRASSQEQEVQLEYNAAIYQMSGEDWKDVELTLSTASPSLMAEGPELAPFWVNLSETPPLAARQRDLLGQQYEGLSRQLREAAREQQAAPVPKKSRGANWKMNVAASNVQNLELVVDKKAIRMARLGRPAVVEGISVNYRLPGRVNVASRSDKQLARIADLKLKSERYYVATPLLTGYVYRQMEMANESELSMLEGPATVYFDDSFVGNSTMPMVAQGQKFTMGFGLDGQLRAGRDLLDRTERTMGANKEITIKYRLTLENYKAAPVEVRVFDRLPYASGRADIRVTLGEMSDKLSDDPFYLQRERPKGILRWDVEVPAGASGANARTVEFDYKLEFDRKLHVTTPIVSGGKAVGVFEKDFEQILDRRRRAR